jgi:hypothetical protein
MMSIASVRDIECFSDDATLSVTLKVMKMDWPRLRDALRAADVLSERDVKQVSRMLNAELG